MITTNGTHPWSFVTRIPHNGYPSLCGNRKLSTYSLGTLGGVASLLTAIFYHGNMTGTAISGISYPMRDTPDAVAL